MPAKSDKTITAAQLAAVAEVDMEEAPDLEPGIFLFEFEDTEYRCDTNVMNTLAWRREIQRGAEQNMLALLLGDAALDRFITIHNGDEDGGMAALNGLIAAFQEASGMGNRSSSRRS